MVSLEKVPVVEVNTDNIIQLWPAIIQAIQSATFLAIDTELSGLGNRRSLNAKAVDERYRHMCEVAHTRSMVALGISCFKLVSPADNQEYNSDGKQQRHRELCFNVQTYNIMLLCSEQYVVEPGSLRFLVEHGFDFNLQYAKGLPYRRGNDKEGDPELSVRNIFTEIVLTQVPIVLHNAFLDVVFLYESLYATLPNSQQMFIADLANMFPAGLYDTKYIADFKARMGASYLEYVFKKCQRNNIQSAEKSWSHIHVTFPKYMQSEYIINMPCTLSVGQHNDRKRDSVCMQYANHGWCPNGSLCTKCHDINVILDVQEQASSGRKKNAKSRSRDSKSIVTKSPEENNDSYDQREIQQQHPDIPASKESDASSGTLDTESLTHTDNDSMLEDLSDVPSASVNKAGSHRAGFDAFMTGYIFAFFSARYGSDTVHSESSFKGHELGMDEHKNKLYLVGKDIPLQITPSSFSKPSKAHLAKMAKIKPQKP